MDSVAVEVSSTVTGMESLSDAKIVYERFKTLTRGHKGLCARNQITGDVTRVMNGLNYGIESRALTLRLLMANPNGYQTSTLVLYDDSVAVSLSSPSV